MNDEIEVEKMLQDSDVPYSMASEPPLSFRAAGYDYDHEVLVTLPRSHAVSPDRSYPVLWAMDGVMMHMLVAGIVNIYTLGGRLPEMIVASVGHSSDQGMAGLVKREFDLHPAGSMFATTSCRRERLPRAAEAPSPSCPPSSRATSSWTFWSTNCARH